jgi:hypothetical protein
VIDDKFLNKEFFLKRCNSTLSKYNISNKNPNMDCKTTRKFLIKDKSIYEPFLKENNNNDKNQNKKQKPNLYKSNSLHKFIEQSEYYLTKQSKGTNLPIQFQRNTPFLYKNFYNNSFIKENNEDNKLNTVLKNCKSQENLEIKENNDFKNIHRLTIRERLHKPHLWDNIDKNILTKQRDKLMPEGFQFYEKLMEKENKKYFQNNYIIRKSPDQKKIPVLIRDTFKERINESDIFFQNKNIKKEDLPNEVSKTKEKAMEAFYSSDIFNKKINPSIIKKSGEISFFKKINKKNTENASYNKNTESVRGWGVRDPVPSLLNYSSSNFNPLNPSIRNFCKTKENIFDECNKKCKGYNPPNKQKSLSEFFDLTNVTASNYNNDYNKIINKNPNVFRKKEDMFTEYYNLYYNNYNSISEKPFYKFCPSLINYNKLSSKICSSSKINNNESQFSNSNNY